MDGPDHRTLGDADPAAEDWLRARLTAHAGEVPVPPPDIARIDARRRGIRRRRTGWAACAVSAVTAGVVVAAVAFAGGGDPDGSADPLPLTPPTTTAPPVENTTTPVQGPTGTAVAPPPPGTAETTGSESGLPEDTNTAAATTTAGTSTTPGTAAPSDGSTKGNPPATNGSSSGSGSTGNSAAACTDKNVSVTASTESNDSGRHLLLTATNTGSTSCTLYFYPDVVLGDGSHDVGPMESPAAVATIAPGKKAYSGVLLFQAGDQVDQVTSFAVNLRNRDNDGYTGNPIDVAIPSTLGGALDIGPNPGTYMWNTDLAQLNRYLYAR